MKTPLTNHTNPKQERNPSQMDLKILLEHYQNARYDIAEDLAKQLTQKYPDHPFSWKILISLYKQTERLTESLIANKKLVDISPNDPEAHSNLGIIFKEFGRLAEAEASYKKAITINPNFAQAHSNLGNTLQELGSLSEAEASYKKAIAINPDFAHAHSNLGNTLKELGRLVEAEASYKKAIAIHPDFAQAHSNLGILLKEFGRLAEAEASFKKAISIKPEYSDAYNSLGNVLKELGRLVEAEASYKKAIAINPDFAEAHNNLGNTLKDFSRFSEAVVSYKRAIALKPNYAEAYNNLGITLQEFDSLAEAEASFKKAIAIKSDFAQAYSNLGFILQEFGKLEDALFTIIKSIKIKSTAEAQSFFIHVIQKIASQIWNQSPLKSAMPSDDVRQFVISALLDPWGRPSTVIPFACLLLKVDKEFARILAQSKNYVNQANFDESLLSSILKKELIFSPLLHAMLISCPIIDAELEVFFSNLRCHLLKKISSIMLKEEEIDEVITLYCSLAQQCFINEYVYFQSPDEIDHSLHLRDQLTRALEGEQCFPTLLIIVVACYFPLYLVKGADKLLQQDWSIDVKQLLKQQIQEPLKELDLRRSIPILTSFENQISLVVQCQYEENPYPRWIRLPKNSNKKFINSYIQSKFPLFPYKCLIDDRNLEILIAGCGTGQHPISTEQLIKTKSILAVDLSIASLAYAKRKTIELGIESIDYAQADLLKIGSLGKTFDLIESIGVLHHLENPFQGWEILLSLLKPHGLMRLGLYSELARRDIGRVRNLIRNKGIGSSSQDIRDYRKYLLGLKNIEDYGWSTKGPDFFSTSACRDLLFHVQEHGMSLSIISNFLKGHDLNFLGFDIDRSVIRAYKNRFPNDLQANDLEQWRIYEEENPDTFTSMYQFWIQRKG
jgi:tetratricopeptide (TPR) repeat protein/2-polyprenyl-3-methyl-5-hydroxy-6-metoxy-1,4-benzoquinol methylase